MKIYDSYVCICIRRAGVYCERADCWIDMMILKADADLFHIKAGSY